MVELSFNALGEQNRLIFSHLAYKALAIAHSTSRINDFFLFLNHISKADTD